jgi:hypothetical protein
MMRFYWSTWQQWRLENSVTGIQDVYDGDLWQKFFLPVFGAELAPNSVAVAISSDGVNVGISGARTVKSVWPVISTLLNLPSWYVHESIYCPF